MKQFKPLSTRQRDLGIFIRLLTYKNTKSCEGVEINIPIVSNSTLNTGNNIVHFPTISSSGEESGIRRIGVWQITSLYRLGSFIIDGAGLPWSEDHSLEDTLICKWYRHPLAHCQYIKGLVDNIKYAKVENSFNLIYLS